MPPKVALLFDVDGHPVELGLSRSSGGTLEGTLRLPAGMPRLSSLVRALGIDPAPVIEALDALPLSNARVVYGSSGDARTFALDCGDAASVVRWTKDRSSFSSLSVKTAIGLSSLPIVGEYLSGAADLSVTGVTAGAGSLSRADIEELRDAKLAPSSLIDAFESSGTLFVDLRLAAKNATVRLALDGGGSPRAAMDPDPPQPAPKRPGAWLNVSKSFGPVSVRRIGVNYRDRRVWVLLDAGCSLAGLTLDVDGLALGFTLAFPPSVSVAAPTSVAVSYTGPASVSGALSVVTGPQGTEYAGQLMLKAADFQITAIGAYANADDKGPASLFAFAVLAKPLGGPPAFFVTAIAAGFGFNRALNVPAPPSVADFPLVRAVNATKEKPSRLGPDTTAGQALGILSSWIPRAAGRSWIAIGVRFTSFRLIDTVALLTARFGRDMEFDLIGLSTLSIPYGDPNPIAYAQLALVASIRPAEGVVLVRGQLTPGSYVLSRDCHLSGGFAFAAWFAGEHAGDFVYTLGGYHPRFVRPRHYPEVPRLGAQWNVDSHLTVKGSLYFALTPSTVMAGGSIEAQWRSGDLRAWFSTQVDFLLCWRPFHYEADVSVSLGASYRVNLLLTSFTVTVHVGVSVRLWGPPIGGYASVDLGVVTITISFGSGQQRKAVTWVDFKTLMLPKPEGAGTYCLTRVSGGLIKDLTAAQAASRVHWIVDPERIELVAESVVPIKTASLTRGTGALEPLKGAWTGAFGVGPVGIEDGRFGSDFAIALHRVRGDREPDAKADEIRLRPVPLVRRLPAAPWKASVALNPGLATANDQRKGMVEDALTGFTLVADPREAETTLSIPVARLQFAETPAAYALAWSAAAPPEAQTDPAVDPWEALAAIANDDTSRARESIVGVLAGQHLAVTAGTDVERLARGARYVLLGPPEIAALGAERSKVA